VIHASVRRFQRGHNPLAVRLDVKGKSVLLKECLMAAAPYQAYKTLFLKRRRPDKRKRHPAWCAARDGERNPSTEATCHPHCLMAAAPYQAYNLSGLQPLFINPQPFHT
ncbi:hypothetical protein, partial [Kosakonia cowanii]|uniref:hypothetical protein n=1 Tax=Kosakonia cowanii TaxID=208223 RepID=UPI0028A24251